MNVMVLLHQNMHKSIYFNIGPHLGPSPSAMNNIDIEAIFGHPPPPIFNGSPGWALKVILSRIDYFNQFYNGDENEYNIHVMYVATNLPMPPSPAPTAPQWGPKVLCR